jgi:hypothetical protein
VLSANQHAGRVCVTGQSAMRKAASTDSLLQLALTNSASFLPPLHECKSAEHGC